MSTYSRANPYTDGAAFVFARTADLEPGDVEVDNGTGQATVTIAVPAGCIWSIRMETILPFPDGAFIDFQDLYSFAEITVRGSVGITIAGPGDTQPNGGDMTALISVTHPGTTTNGRVRVVPIFWKVPA